MKTMRVVSLVTICLLVPAVVAAAPAHSLEVVESTKSLLTDIAYYLKYVLPAVAVCYAVWGGMQRAMSGDDEMKRGKADRTLTNAKFGLVIGLVAVPLLNWLQAYYGGAA